MSDFRNPNDPNWNGSYEPPTRGTDFSWGWIAGAVALVILVAVVFGIGHGPTQTASNDTTPPAMSRTAPAPANPHPMAPATPGLVPPPAQPGSAQ